MSKTKSWVFDELEKAEREPYGHMSYVVEPDEENMQPSYQKAKTEYEKEVRETPF